MIGLPYAQQLTLKRGRVLQSLARYPALELVYAEAVTPAEERTRYRTRAKLMAGAGAKLGLFAKGGGHQVVDIPGCRVLAPPLAQVAAHLRVMMSRWEGAATILAPVAPGGLGCLRAIDLREARVGDSARVLVTFVVDHARATDLRSLRAAAEELLQALPVVVGVAANYHPGDSPQVLGAATVPLAGASSAPDQIGACLHTATFGSFVQANRHQAARIHALLAQLVGLTRPREARPRVLDLYGGSGAIALGLAAAGARVKLVESFGPAVAQARAAAHAQALDVEVDCDDVANALRGVVGRRERFDAIVVNPPRRGTSPMAREWLARAGAPLIAYVSCDPETLARDLDHLGRLGYATTSLQPLDMIPLTDEIESVAVLRRSGIPLPRVVYEDAEILILDKGPHEPTVPQAEYASSLLGRARRLPGAQLAVPVHRLDAGTSGLVLLARTPASLPKWETALAAARKIYVVAVRGVTPTKGAVVRDLQEEGRRYPARTRYRRLAIASGASVLRVVPDQGRAHQVRRHMAAIGHPVLGDDRYGHGPANRYFEEKMALDRSFLHGVRLEITHPDTGLRHVFDAPLPGDLRAVLERMNGGRVVRAFVRRRWRGPPRRRRDLSDRRAPRHRPGRRRPVGRPRAVERRTSRTVTLGQARPVRAAPRISPAPRDIARRTWVGQDSESPAYQAAPAARAAPLRTRNSRQGSPPAPYTRRASHALCRRCRPTRERRTSSA